MQCPVCYEKAYSLYSQINELKYFQCQSCKAIYLDKKHYLGQQEEKLRYELHNNELNDPSYRKFLSQLHNPLIKKLVKGSSGLDYGCGPGPALAEMFKESSCCMDLYDPFFFPDESYKNKTYDFVTCSEAAEHFFNPLEEFQKIDKILKKGGWFGMMTNFYDESIPFKDWYYRKDPTHVVFYSLETVSTIASMMTWSWEIPSQNVVLFQK